MYVRVFYVCNLFACVPVALYLCCSFWIDCHKKLVSFRMFSKPFGLPASLQPV